MKKCEARKSGDNSTEATPVPIPNTEVKFRSADDTWRATAWESRTLPVWKRAMIVALFLYNFNIEHYNQNNNSYGLLR